MSRYLSILVLSAALLVSVSAASAADQALVESGQAMIEVQQGLKRIFVFPNFEMSMRECGEANAFSDGATGNITLCTELIDAIFGAPDLDVDTKAAALTFVLLHEIGHSLLNLWGEPLWDNEDAADEFAAVFLLIGGGDEIVRQASTYWASEGSIFQALSKVWIDDRHSLSEQRARNLQSWVGRRDELLQRWQRRFIPHLQTNMLQELARGEDKSWVDRTLLDEELKRRRGLQDAEITQPAQARVYIWIGEFTVTFETADRQRHTVETADTLGIYSEDDFHVWRAKEVEARNELIRKFLTSKKARVLNVELKAIERQVFEDQAEREEWTERGR